MKKTTINSLYLHVPFCKHLCNYCDFYKKKLTSNDDFSGFEKHLLESFEALKKFLDQNEIEVDSLETLYLGGGTPSLWGSRGASFLEKHILSSWPLKKGAEFTIEVDPDSYLKEDLVRFKEIGVNRFSAGMQSFDDTYLKILDRQHSKSQCEKLFKDLNDLGVDFTTDFLIGVPHSEKKRDLLKELSEVLNFNPVHMSLYILSTRANYPHKNNLPSDEWIEEEYLSVSEFLKTHGFEHYEISNFAKDLKYSKHNLAYWDHKSVLALGPNATGLIHLKDQVLRYQWKSSSPTWTEEILDEEALNLEEIFLGLRTKWGISVLEHFKNPSSYFSLFESLVKRELAHFDGENLSLTPRGYLLQDSIMDEMFRVSV